MVLQIENDVYWDKIRMASRSNGLPALLNVSTAVIQIEVR